MTIPTAIAIATDLLPTHVVLAHVAAATGRHPRTIREWSRPEGPGRGYAAPSEEDARAVLDALRQLHRERAAAHQRAAEAL